MGYYAVTRANNTDELYHYGVKGMKWGVRRANYYGNGKSKFKASNGLTVGAPKNRRVEAFRKVQGTKVGSSALNGMAKANTAFYGRGKNKAKWKRFEEQVRKENQAVRESNQAHKTAKKEQNKANKKPMSTAKKVAIGATATAVIVGGAYGAYKLSKVVKNKNTVSKGKTFVQNMAKSKSYAEMNASEAREMREKAIQEAYKNGYKPGNYKKNSLGINVPERGYDAELGDALTYLLRSRR